MVLHTFRVDASFDKQQGITSIGLILRATNKAGRDGAVVAGFSESYIGLPIRAGEQFVVLRALEGTLLTSTFPFRSYSGSCGRIGPCEPQWPRHSPLEWIQPEDGEPCFCHGSKLFPLQFHQDSPYTANAPTYGRWRNRPPVKRRGLGCPRGSLRAAESGISEAGFATVSKSLRYCVRHITRTQYMHVTAGVS